MMITPITKQELNILLRNLFSKIYAINRIKKEKWCDIKIKLHIIPNIFYVTERVLNLNKNKKNKRVIHNVVIVKKAILDLNTIKMGIIIFKEFCKLILKDSL
jgi:hypothetical protein